MNEFLWVITDKLHDFRWMINQKECFVWDCIDCKESFIEKKASE